MSLQDGVMASIQVTILVVSRLCGFIEIIAIFYLISRAKKAKLNIILRLRGLREI
jgi:hypothetical protein